jgi:hypothetical protein
LAAAADQSIDFPHAAQVIRTRRDILDILDILDIDGSPQITGALQAFSRDRTRILNVIRYRHRPIRLCRSRGANVPSALMISAVDHRRGECT